MAKSERYTVVDKSITVHCCFEYSVLDTSIKIEHDFERARQVVCECFEEEDANLIAQALNNLEEK